MSSSFALKQLEKHGWKKGSGLGKDEHGIIDPVKASLKMDKAGVGHDPGKEFTDHWWMRAFNEAAKKIGSQPETKKSEVEKKKEKKLSLYGGFVKGSTLTNGIEEKSENSGSSDSDDGSTEERVPTLQDIHKFCGGATGHKAARFGYKMGGKLARVARHDQMWEKKIMEEKQNSDAKAVTKITSDTEESSCEPSKQKKRKKNKRNIDDGTSNEKSRKTNTCRSEVEESLSTGNDKDKNGNKVAKESVIAEEEVCARNERLQYSEESCVHKSKRKKEKKRKSSATLENCINDNVHSSTKNNDDEDLQKIITENSNSTTEFKSEKKKKKRHEQEKDHVQYVEKKKRKKKKKSKQS